MIDLGKFELYHTYSDNEVLLFSCQNNAPIPFYQNIQNFDAVISAISFSLLQY